MAGIGFDAGTFTLICSRRDADGNIKKKEGINAFIEIPLDNRYMFNLLKKANVAVIEWNDVAHVFGEDAVNMAYTLGLELKRPMKDGCLNPSEKDAIRVLNIAINSLIGSTDNEKETLYYSVPANAVNQETDADFHNKVLEDIFKKYKVDGHSLDAHPINEGLALVFAELAHKNYTGIGISWGAGMVNICYAIYSQPVFAVSLVHSGDWIDRQAAKACGETPTIINREKMKIDLLKPPKTLMERAIISQYRILIEKTVSNIKDIIVKSGTKVRTQEPLDIVLGGGTCSPPGFVEIFKETLESAKYPIPIGEIIKPEDNLYSVSRGCLIAAENSL
jgi:hypothetical protein